MVEQHRPQPCLTRADGCTLVEVLVAMLCLVVAIACVAQVYGMAGQTVRRAKQMTVATILAQDKMEALVAQATSGSLSSSPPGTLTTNVAGCFDVVSGLVRRWSVDPLPAAPDEAVVIQVLVDRTHLVTVRRKVL